MSEFDRDILRENYHALNDIKKIVGESAGPSHVVERNAVREYENFLRLADSELPGLLLPFNAIEYAVNTNSRSEYYRSAGILMHMSRNLGKLKVKVDDNAQTPVTVSKSFHFIGDTSLRGILERDYQELQRGIISNNWKSAILLSGGSIEAILLDLLIKNSIIALASSKAPGEADLNKWSLNNLIEVAVEERLINSGVATLSHSVRDYRNLIHPGVEIRKSLKVEPEEAKIAMNVLDMLIRELS